MVICSSQFSTIEATIIVPFMCLENSYCLPRCTEQRGCDIVRCLWRFVFHQFWRTSRESNGYRSCCSYAAQQNIAIHTWKTDKHVGISKFSFIFILKSHTSHCNPLFLLSTFLVSLANLSPAYLLFSLSL
jgi:hypothetical protein